MQSAVDAGLAKRLLLISAPAGSGKTTLMAQWAASPERQSRPIAWCSLDPQDNQPLLFWTRVIQALTGLSGSDGAWLLDDSLSLVRAEIPPAWPVILSVLQAELSTLPKPVILVLDNYQVIQDETIHASVADWIEQLPGQLKVILITRKDPPFPLPAWRAKGLLAEIRLSSLRFTYQETLQACSQGAYLGLSADSIERVGASAEGWITGICLAAFVLVDKNEAETASLLAGLSGQQGSVLQTLLDASLSRLAETERAFLLKTSILSRFSPGLANAVLAGHQPGSSGQDQAPLSPGSLASVFPFIQPVDAHGEWYACQPFIRELLLARLEADYPGQAFWLHRRAAEWFSQQGMASRAIYHAAMAQDDELAADFLEQALHQPTAWTDAELAASLSWLSHLSETVLSHHPWVRLFAFLKRSPLEQVMVGDCFLEQLEKEVIQTPRTTQEVGRLIALIYEIRASLAVIRNSPNQAVLYANRALEIIPPDFHLAISQAYLALGESQCLLGLSGAAHQSLAQAASLALSSGYRIIALQAAVDQAGLQIAQGQIEAARQTCEKTAAIGSFAGQPVPQLGGGRWLQSVIAWHTNDLASAQKMAFEAVTWLNRGDTPSERLPEAQAWLALVFQARGEVERANLAIQAALERAGETRNPQSLSLVSAYQARIWLAQQDIPRAVAWAGQYRALPTDDTLHPFEELTLARCLLADNLPDQALTRLDAFHRRASAAGWITWVIETLALRALSLQCLVNQAKAVDSLGQALFLAEPQGLTRIFLGEGQPMQMIILALRKQLSQDASPSPDEAAPAEGQSFKRLIGFIDSLLAAFPPLPDSLDAGLQATQGTIEPLNAREASVLELLARGLAEREIAQKLFFSPNTLRAYTASLFNKLGVSNRFDAVARARQAGLIPPAREESH